MKITDCNKNLNSKDQFQIEVNDVWYTVEANDFFDYLYNAGRIDGHDLIDRTAWIESWETSWNPARQEWEERPTGESHSYDWWIEEFVDNDEVLLDYMKTVFATYPVAEAA